jgi:hypothetical protein
VKIAKEKELYTKSTKYLRAELNNRSNSFIETLSAMQTMIKSISKEVSDWKVKHRELSNQAQLLQNFCMQLKEKLSTSPISKMQPELCKVFEILFAKISVLREKNDEVQDEVAVLHVGVEEEKR